MFVTRYIYTNVLWTILGLETIQLFPRMRFRLRASDFWPDRILNFSNRSNLPRISICAETSDLLCVCGDSRASAETDCCCCGLGPRRNALGALHARKTQASEPTPAAFGLAAKRRAECATIRVNLFWYFVVHHLTDYCCCCCTSLRGRIHGEVRAECAPLGL